MTNLEWNARHPFYIYPSVKTNQLLIDTLLEGGNYHTWSREVRRSLGSKNKLYFVHDNTRIEKPKNGDKFYESMNQTIRQRACCGWTKLRRYG